MGLGDSTQALTDFTKSATLIEANTHTRTDLLIGYVFRNKAILERYFSHNTDAALASLDKGKSLLDREFVKYDKLKEEKAEDYAKAQKQ